MVRTNLFDAKYMTDRIQKSFMGNWGSKVAQDADQKAYCQELIRLSYFGSVSYLRRVHKELPSTTAPGQKKGTSKAVVPRMLHASEYGVICPVETPDGGNIGKIKHLSTFAFVCPELPPEDRALLMRHVRQFALPVHELDSFYKLESYHKVIVDGNWCFVCPAATRASSSESALQQPMLRTRRGSRSAAKGAPTMEHPNIPLPPDQFVEVLRLLRRNGLLSPLVSVSWNIARQEIVIMTQEGRVLRPLLAVEHGLLRFADGLHNSPQASERWSWAELLSGRDHEHMRTPDSRLQYHDLSHRYDQPDGSGWRAKAPLFDTQPMRATLQQLRKVSGVMEYLDPFESGTRMIAMTPQQLPSRRVFFEQLLADPAADRTGVAFAHSKQENALTALLLEDHPAHCKRRHHPARRSCSCLA